MIKRLMIIYSEWYVDEGVEVYYPKVIKAVNSRLSDLKQCFRLKALIGWSLPPPIRWQYLNCQGRLWLSCSDFIYIIKNRK
jgi:hypothetical protein